MHKIEFQDVMEVRMGSPFNTASVAITGDFKPNLADTMFQDKSAVSKDGLTCFLVEWAIHSNSAAFRIWKISEINRTVSKSRVITGCCEDLSLSDDGSLFVKVFLNGQSTTQIVENFA